MFPIERPIVIKNPAKAGFFITVILAEGKEPQEIPHRFTLSG